MSLTPAGTGPLGLGLPMAQAEIGHAALKVGGSILIGMRTHGGMAHSAAKSRVGSVGSGSSSRHATWERSGGCVARFFSQSASSEGVVGEREVEPRMERGWCWSWSFAWTCGCSGSGGRLRVQRQLVPDHVYACQSSHPTLLPPHTQVNTMGTSPPLSISSDSSSPP
jgi:hypothetical protein